MHQTISNSSTNILNLIDEFKDQYYQTDYHDSPDRIMDVKLVSGISNNSSDLCDSLCRKSYGTDYAYVGTYIPKKVSKGFTNAMEDFKKKWKDYTDFKAELDITYGRKSSKVTCPRCESNISLAFGKRKTCCPVCGSRKIISDSNWKRLDTKLEILKKAASKLSLEIGKIGGKFICGFEYHC